MTVILHNAKKFSAKIAKNADIEKQIISFLLLCVLKAVQSYENKWFHIPTSPEKIYALTKEIFFSNQSVARLSEH